jgi:hypothetical protein
MGECFASLELLLTLGVSLGLSEIFNALGEGV